MLRVEFRILCANRNTACDRAKSLMTDFEKLENASPEKMYDYHGTRYFETVAKAKERRDEIFNKAGDDVKGIELAIG